MLISVISDVWSQQEKKNVNTKKMWQAKCFDLIFVWETYDLKTLFVVSNTRQSVANIRETNFSRMACGQPAGTGKHMISVISVR